jgi:hypothetical protein
MPVWKSCVQKNNKPAAARFFCLIGLLLFLFPLALVAQDEEGFRVSNLKANLINDQYLMDADIQYQLSEKALEALVNGVPLTLEVHLQVRRRGAWIWENDLLDVRLRYQIRYHALAELYQVHDLQSDSQQNFVTRDSALAALGTIRNVPVIKQEKLEAGEVYNMALKTVLDIEALPLPLRPTAYLSPAWNLSSEWRVWPLQP